MELKEGERSEKIIVKRGGGGGDRRLFGKKKTGERFIREPSRIGRGYERILQKRDVAGTEKIPQKDSHGKSKD